MEEATPNVPVQPPAPATPPPQQAGGFQWDEEKKNISIWCLVAGIASAYIEMIGAYFGAKYLMANAYNSIDPTGALNSLAQNYAPPVAFDFTNPLFGGIVRGVVMAALLFFCYRPVYAWVQKQSFGKYVDTFFKIIFYPYLILAALSLVLGGFYNLKATLFIVLFTLAASFVFSKILDIKLSQYFPPKKA
ncbi:hypothetical protein HZA43_00090 [Candidatus Peregrinibacteria bacterium]|nr:hypothetical protein [Candidatus Peregrinibacteria bacterium]